MICPQCQSAQCQRTELVWRSQVRTRQLPARWATGAQETVWVPREDITEITELGRRLAPPSPPREHRMGRLAAAIVSYFFGVSIGSTIGALSGALLGYAIKFFVPAGFWKTLGAYHWIQTMYPQGFPPLLAIGLAIGAVGGFLVMWRLARAKPVGWKSAHTTYQTSLDHWQREWFCKQCGHQWIPDA